MTEGKVAKTKSIKKRKANKGLGTDENFRAINLGNRLSIDKIESIRNKILTELANNERIRLVSDTCEVIDLTFIQLLHSLKMSIDWKNIEVDINLQNEQIDLLKKAGVYDSFFGSIQ